MKRGRGLTFVEFLVVLLVVAVAAALIYPVFGSAREASKRRLCMSNLRKLGRAISGYVTANDNRYPLAITRDSETWLPGQKQNFPDDWSESSTDERRRASSVWANAIRNTVERSDYACPQSMETDAADTVQRAEPWAQSYSYNGYLNSLPASLIESAEDCIILWEGQGKAATLGWVVSNPMPLCNQEIECTFSRRMRSKLALPKALSLSNTMWVHGRGANFLLADLHVRWRRLGASTGARTTDRRNDPFRTYDKTGNPTSAWLENGIAPMFAPN